MISYYQQISDFLDQAYDDRLSHLPLMGSIYKILTVVILYLLFVKKIGPKFMESRQPYNLSYIMPYYNAFQVLSNLWCTIYFSMIYFEQEKGFDDCPMPHLEHNELNNRVAVYSYIYYMLKVLDLIDTIFIILKKNYRQASVLHIYHHTVMVLGAYLYTQYYCGGAYIIPGTLNAFTHVCMYSYFFLTTTRPDFKQSVWWKKNITHVQMIQFSLNFIYFTRIVLNNECKYSRFWSWLGVTQNITFFLMFANFYVRNYIFVEKPKLKE